MDDDMATKISVDSSKARFAFGNMLQQISVPDTSGYYKSQFLTICYGRFFCRAHRDDKSLFKFGETARHLNISLSEVEVISRRFGKDLLKLELMSSHFCWN